MKLRSITANTLAELTEKLNNRNVDRAYLQLIVPEGKGYTALYWGNDYTAELTYTADDDFFVSIEMEAESRRAAFEAARDLFKKMYPHPNGKQGKRYQLNCNGWTDYTPDGNYIGEYEITINERED